VGDYYYRAVVYPQRYKTHSNFLCLFEYFFGALWNAQFAAGVFAKKCKFFHLNDSDIEKLCIIE